MKVAARPALPHFSFLPIRESLRAEPMEEEEAALMDFFLVFPFTRLPMIYWGGGGVVDGVSVVWGLLGVGLNI